MRLVFVLLLALCLAPAAAAQQVWLQVEAVPTLRQAQARAQSYAGAFPNVGGFRLPSGWYAIALGPYGENVARSELQALKARGLIPRDSFVEETTRFRQQFYPVGATPPVQAAPAPTAETDEQQTAETTPTPDPLPVPYPAEPPGAARASPRLLTEEERKLIQEALQWDGYYTSSIDGAFGRGTRRAMTDWQSEQGFEATGVLTTRQRRKLTDTYQAVFADLGLQSVRDQKAGIEITMPAGKVKRSRLEPPFVHYDGEDGVKVLLISQRGDQNTLFGLYDIMQTLEIVPTEGERERKPTSFSITGRDSKRQSFTYAI
ncbi:MAG: peptidoglycan-binding domain-containing protein, partial [Pseudomonadota bacterium]